MSKDFKLIDNFRGYVTKPDETNTSARFLGSGSLNVIINDAEKVASRQGYTIDGANNTATNGITSSFDWDTNVGTEINLRSYDDELEWRETDPTSGDITWRRVADGWSAVDFVFTTWWDSTESRDLCLFVNGDANIYEWNGAYAYISATTTNTITKTGTATWGEAGFYVTRNKTVVINGTEYAYTGGEGTTTLTGVTPDPTGEADASVVIQKIVTNANKPASGGQNDVIAMLNNQIYVGSNITRSVNVSSNSDFTDFTFSSPRVPGEGATLTLDSHTIGFAPQEQDMYITSGKGDWYRTNFDLKSSGASTFMEELTVKKLKTGPRQAAQHHDLIGKAKNNTIYISNEPTLDELGRLENLETPQSKPLSDPIKPDFNAATFTSGHIKYWRGSIYIAAPNDSRVYIFDIANGLWQPPQLYGGGFSRFSIIGGNLYGHSSINPETFKLFDGTNDDGGIITFNATFVYRNFGERANVKVFDEHFTEGYISASTNLDVALKYDYQGSAATQEYTIDGGDDDITFGVSAGAGLGKQSLGKAPLGTDIEAAADLRKFRTIYETRPIEFYELQIVYSTTDDDAQFEILSQGPNARLAPDDNVNIKIS